MAASVVWYGRQNEFIAVITSFRSYLSLQPPLTITISHN
jgi:hypothetical protein